MKFTSHSVCSSSLNLPLCFLSSLLPRVLASQANAGFTTTNWNPTRGVKFTMAWSGTSDAGLKNITLFDCDSSGNQFAVFGPIATGIDGGSFQWIPPTTIPDGTYIVNLVETPNKVNTNGLSFNGNPFAFGDPSANQQQSQTSTTVARQTLVVTTTPEAEKTTVVAPTTILLVSTQSAEFTVQSTTFSDLVAPAEVTSSGEIPTISASALGSTSAEGSSSVDSSISTTTSPSTSSTSTPKITTTFPFISPTSSHPPSSSPTQTNPPTSKSTPSTLHPAILAAIIVSITALFFLSVITSILLYRRRRQTHKNTQNPDRRFSTSSSAPLTTSREEGYDGGGMKKNKKGWLSSVGKIWRGRRGRENEKGKVQNDPMFYDGGKRGWVMRVNSKPVELLSDGKRWL